MYLELGMNYYVGEMGIWMKWRRGGEGREVCSWEKSGIGHESPEKDIF